VERSPRESPARAVRKVQNVGRLFWFWGPVAALAAGIFYLSSQALPEVIAPGPGFDKVAHFGVYGLLGALLARAFFGTTRMGTVPTIFLAAVLGGLYGVTDEIHQSFVPARSAEVLDAVADAAGSLAGALGYAFVRARWLARGRRKSSATSSPGCSG
jgi:VanZ family protein